MRQISTIFRTVFPFLLTVLFSESVFSESKKPVVFSEADAVQIALQKNPRLAEFRMQLREAEAQYRAQHGLYPWVFNANAGFRYDEQPSVDVIQTGTRQTTLYQGAVEILKQFTIGTQLSARLDINRNTSKVPFTIPDLNISEIRELGPNYGSALSLKINQPLLKGFGKEIYELPISTALQQIKASKLQLHNQAQTLVSEILRAYWTWVKANWEFEAAEARLIRTKWLSELTSAQIQAGTLAAIERDVVDQQIAGAEQALLSAELAIENAKDDLREFLGSQEFEFQSAPKMVKTPAIKSLDDTLEEAKKASTELALVETEMDTSKLNIMRLENERRAKLDAVASITQAGLSDAPLRSLEQIGTLEFSSFYVGLSLSIPLDSTKANYELEAIHSRVLRSEFRKKAVWNALRTQVKKAYRLITIQEKRSELSEKEMRLARKNLKAMQAKFEAGQASHFDVIQVEDSLRDAELRNRQIKIELILAAIALKRLDGSLLKAYSNSLKE